MSLKESQQLDDLLQEIIDLVHKYKTIDISNANHLIGLGKLIQTDENYVRFLYWLILDREPDPEGLKLYVESLKDGWERVELVTNFINSQEFHNRLSHTSKQLFPVIQTDVKKLLINLQKFKIYVQNDDFAVGQTIINTKNYEPHVTDAIAKLLKPGDTFLDIGANIGYYSLLAASIVQSSGKVIAFEPNQKNQQLMYSSIVENNFSNITLYPFAVSNSQKILRLMTSGSNGWLVNLSKDSAEYQLVQSVVIDEILETEKQIDFIKIDIEGHEPIALQGMVRTIHEHRPIIFTEFHPYAVGEEFLKQLTSYGYRLSIIEMEEVGKITDSPNTSFIMEFWEKLVERVKFDKIHLDLMATPL